MRIRRKTIAQVTFVCDGTNNIKFNQIYAYKIQKISIRLNTVKINMVGSEKNNYQSYFILFFF